MGVVGCFAVDDTVKQVERFWAKVRKTPECWWWTGSVGGGGYGRFYRGGGKEAAHRWAYRHEVGPIPEGLTLDHLCRNRPCVRPSHLEPVSLRENILRGEGAGVFNSRKTHCPQGHPYDEANTRWYRGGRYCRACHTNAARGHDAAYWREYRRRRREDGRPVR